MSKLKAKYLKIEITKNNIKTVDLSMPAKSIQWIIELMPQDILKNISERKIDLERIQEKYKKEEILPGEIFELITPQKKIRVWLE